MTKLLALLPLVLACCAPPGQDAAAPNPLGEPSVPAAMAAPWSSTESMAWGAGTGTGALAQRPLAQPPTADYHLQVELRVDEAAVEDDPVHQLSTFAYYNNNSDLGGYEAALLLRQEGQDHYRLLISAHHGEALLWSSRGGVLQVRPFAFQVGERYTLHASAIGARVTLAVNDAPLIDYTDRVVPIQRGGAALGRMYGSTSLGKAVLWTATSAEVSGLAAPTPHVARLALRTWKGMRWAFDGDEPIFALGLPPNYRETFMPRTYECVGFEVKLVPGYVPQLYLPWYIQNWSNETFTPANLEELRILEEGERLQLSLRCMDPVARPDLTSLALLTVSYDALGNVYRYDTSTTLTVPQGSTLKVDAPMDFVDPGLYNGVQSGSPQGKTWAEPHPFSVYQQEAGGVYKQPHNHMDWYPGYGLSAWYAARMNYMKKDSGFWAEVGDPVANPIFQMLGAPPSGSIQSLMCFWAYDMHLSWEPATPELAPGDYTIRWRMTSLSGSAGAALLKSASYALPTDLKATWLLYTGGIGHTERFDKVVLKASSFGEFPWGEGALQDNTVGHGDSTSLRFTGPGYAQSSAGESRFGENFLPETDYEVSVWIKTQGVAGQGPGLYFGDQAHYPGLRGSNDWQRVSIVVRPQGDLNVQTFGLHHAGAGTVWFDDFLIRPITTERPADPGSATALTPITRALAAQPPRPEMRLWWSAASETSDGTLLDQSGWGNHGQLLGARFADEVDARGQRTRVLEIPGDGAQALLPGYPALDLGEKATIALWVKPGQNLGTVMTLLSGGVERTDLWRVQLVGEGAPWQLFVELPGGLAASDYIIEEGRWHHLAITNDGSQVLTYVDGRLVAQGQARGRWLGLGAEGYLRLGSGRYESGVLAPVAARMGKLQIYPRALTPAEVQALSQSSLFAP